ncbi:hypothetical protein LTR36_002098 [Oleoguttula mirabilis]|uniref:Uncharacterized protein n=1 Tax=Oleoguttula mirabilis TaxID=1507867 RepID=A0AAV9JLP5_9PEZI|nr:hypothetical protein LTR36_002098 [Oleoguttula mirabilis]
MDIKCSRRILGVGAPRSRILDVVKDLTGSTPAPDETGSTAGLTHEWDVKTAYYSAKVPIWVDEIPETEAWKTEFLKPEAQEVVEAVGAWIYCFTKPRDGTVSEEMEEVMKAIQNIAEEHAGYGAETVMLAVAMPNRQQAETEASGASPEEWDDVCMQYGFEYIDYSAQGKNDFGEKVGFERLKEALEATAWAATADDEDDLTFDELEFDDEDEVGGFGREEAEMTAELFGMKAALYEDDDDEHETDDAVPPREQATQVDDLERMMGKLLAVKERSADLPEAQRKRMAAQAVRDLMNSDRGA